MKKILYTLLLSIAFISCETNTVEVERSAGMVYNGQSEGK